MATKFTPLHDRILVRRIEEAGSTRGGIIIPDSAKDKPQEGQVISIGKGKTNDEGKLFPLAVKERDRRSQEIACSLRPLLAYRCESRRAILLADCNNTPGRTSELKTLIF